MELMTVAQNLRKAACPEDIFGGDGSQITEIYRQLIVVVHPDHFDKPKELAIAHEAFQKLTEMRAAATRKVVAGTYGKKDVAAPLPKDSFRPIAIEARGQKIILNDDIATGDVCDVYKCLLPTTVGDAPAVFKIVRAGTDNDMMENERRVLRKLFPPEAKDEKFYRFLPRLLDSFVVRAPGSQRRVNLLTWFPEHRTLSEVLQVFPDGIDYRDMAWMFKRILHGVGWAHYNHIVHGAILPPHVMVHPVDHGAKILDWVYAVDITPEEAKPTPSRCRGSLYDHLRDDTFLTTPHVKAISGPHRDYYPPEVFKKAIPTPALDIFMAAKCAVALVGSDVKTNRMPDTVPGRVQDFFKGCLDPDPAKRPQNAWDAHESFEKVLETVVGKRKYRPFPMPQK